MRTAAIGTGSVADQLNGLVILLNGCADLREIEYRWPRLVRGLENVANRVSVARSRGGSIPGLDTAAAWLESTVRDHAALQGPDGEPIRTELLGIVGRIRSLAA
jgi:hypothetical protein